MKSLKFRGKMILGTAVIFLVGFGLLLGGLQHRAGLDREVMAAVSNPSPGSPGYMMVILPMNGNHTSSTTNAIRFKMPWPATLLGASAIVRTSGAAGTMTIDVTETGTTVLSGAISVNPTTVTEGTIADSAIADEAVIGITTTISSAGAIWVDPTVQLNFKRK